MHYYQFNIGDYQSHTAHLSELEDLAYRRLLDWIYLHEKPIPLEINEVARNIRMRTQSESIAIVLQEFFIRTEAGWVSTRVQREIDKAGDKSQKASQSAKARWDADALRKQSESNATHNTLPITQNPIPITQNTTDTVENATISPSTPDATGASAVTPAPPETPLPSEQLPAAPSASRSVN